MGALLPVLALLSFTACPSPTPPVPVDPTEPTTPEPPPPPPPSPTPVTRSFTNPVRAAIPGGGVVENCPDPDIIHGQGDDTAWYIVCTSDPLNGQDRNTSGGYRQHLLPILKSEDLVSWTYVGDALSALPGWARPGTDVWAPDIVYFNDKYYLYFSVVDTLEGGSAIGVATSTSPAGPWTVSNKPAVEPHENICCGNSRRLTIDSEVLLGDNGERYIYYGSYYGGISVRRLSADGLTSDPYTQVEVAIPNRYEAANVIRHGEYYYLLASASDCCRGALTGYSVFAGRSKQPYGPFVDREGVRLTYNQVGGTPVLGANGNRWIGTGHNAVFTDMGGQDWIVYHAMDRHDVYLPAVSGEKFPPKRQLLMDALDWVDGWPVARGGQGPSDSEQPAPAARANEKSRYVLAPAAQDLPGAVLPAFSDEFDGASLGAAWSWTRPPAMSEYGLENGRFRFNTQGRDIYEDDATASILWRPAPTGDFLVETKMTLDLPPVGCCHNFVQAGLIVQKDDDNYVRLTHLSLYETRQIAFSKEVSRDQLAPDVERSFGDTFGGPVDGTVWLRIVRRVRGAEEHYTAWSSRDGTTWSRTATWAHALGPAPRLGLLGVSGTGFVATFDYVRVHELKQ